MEKVKSKDGTSIAYDRAGKGSAIILVGGAFQQRADHLMESLLARLSPSFTIINYDRRGRGDSGDTAPYAVEREVEDIDALIKAAGGSASLFGMSSGGVLALEAARTLAITKLALYEPPFIVGGGRPPLPKDYVAHLQELIAAGRRGDAVVYFMTAAIGMPEEAVAPMRQAPFWQGMEAVAHTLSYDGTIMGDSMSGRPEPIQRWASVTVPTLVMDGGASPEFQHDGVQLLADTLPHARRRTLEGQTHDVAPEILAPVLEEFFAR